MIMKLNDFGSVMSLEAADVGVVHSGVYYIIGITWTSDEGSGLDIAADDDFMLQDANGDTIFRKRAEAATDPLEITFAYPIPSNGIQLTKMDGGVCNIYLKVL